MPRAAPPRTPKSRPSSASNAIFMGVISWIDVRRASHCVAAGAAKVQREGENNDEAPFRAPTGPQEARPDARLPACRDSRATPMQLYLVGFLVRQVGGDVAFEPLLHQFERVDDLANLRDAA